jgi:hypothetical protein
MRILLDVTHPADVHFFARPLANWRREGHDVAVVARDKDIALALLERLGIAFEAVGRAGRGVLGLARELVVRQARLARLMRARPPDVVAGFGGTFVVHPAWLLGVRRVVFTDTENARVSNGITLPFASLVCTPRCYPRRRRARELRFQGYKELSYLHPRHFTPDPAAPAAAGLERGEPFVFVRLVSWHSGHDLFDHGLTDARAAVRRLQRHARVVLSAEGALPDDLEPLRFRGPLERVHHVLARARLYFGESPTMAAEAAMLGVPAVVVSTSRRSYIDELGARYGLVAHFDHRTRGQREALAHAEALLRDEGSAALWQERRARMLDEQEDVAEFVTDVVVGRRGAP